MTFVRIFDNSSQKVYNIFVATRGQPLLGLHRLHPFEHSILETSFARFCAQRSAILPGHRCIAVVPLAFWRPILIFPMFRAAHSRLLDSNAIASLQVVDQSTNSLSHGDPREIPTYGLWTLLTVSMRSTAHLSSGIWSFEHVEDTGERYVESSELSIGWSANHQPPSFLSVLDILCPSSELTWPEVHWNGHPLKECRVVPFSVLSTVT